MLDHSEERLAAIVESSFDAIISKDLDGIIRSWNGTAERMFGYTQDEAVGKPIYLIIPPTKQQEEADLLQRLKRAERIETFETLRLHRTGRLVPVSITISPIKSKSGELIGSSSIARDISQTKESERRLRLLMKEINHRVRNQYAVVLSVIRQTAIRAGSVQVFEGRIRERVMALSHSHDLLSDVDWKGVSLRSLFIHHAKAFSSLPALKLSGEDLDLDPNAVLNIGMAVHELLSNAARFGHDRPQSICLEWTVTGTGPDAVFSLTWTELAGDGHKVPEEAGGFGMLVLTRIVPSALSGSARWASEGSAITWSFSSPLAHIVARTNDFAFAV